MRASKEDTLDANLFYYEKGNTMDAFDYVMESLSRLDDLYFNSKNDEAKKVISDYKKLTKSIIVKTKKADAYIKAHPGCDKDTHEDGSANPEYNQAYKYVEDAYNDLDSLSMRVFNLEKYPSSDLEYSARDLSITGIVVSLICLVLAPFIPAYSIVMAGPGITSAVIGGVIANREAKANLKRWENKENEWKSVNQENALDKLKEISSAIEDLDLAFKKKYSPWID